MKVPYALVVGSVLRDARKKNNLKLADYESIPGITQSMASRFENGRCSLAVETLLKLCAVFDYSLSGFFADVEKRVKFLADNNVQTINVSLHEERTIEEIISTITELKVLNKVLINYKTQ